MKAKADAFSDADEEENPVAITFPKIEAAHEVSCVHC
jgi:hypothetical protein